MRGRRGREKCECPLVDLGNHPDPARQPSHPAAAATIDLGYACVVLDGYPVRILPPSGVVQLAAFGAIQAEVRGRAGE